MDTVNPAQKEQKVAGNPTHLPNESVKADATKIAIILPTTAYFMSGIRDFTLGLIKNTTEFGEKWAYRFQSIVDELCNNAIEFGSEKGSDIKITFYYEPGDYIEISVEDTGTGKSKMKAAEIEKLIEERSKPGYVNTGLRGRGLSMIAKSWSDELKFEDVENGGIKSSVKKYLKESEEVMKQLGEMKETDPTKIIL